MLVQTCQNVILLESHAAAHVFSRRGTFMLLLSKFNVLTKMTFMREPEEGCRGSGAPPPPPLKVTKM